jgi:thiol-disulfide isomerase/thioredoxin
MPDLNMRKIPLLIVAAFVLVAVTYAMRRERPVPPRTPVSVAERPVPTPGGDALPVIRFVKNPEAAPPLQGRDLSGAAVSGVDWNGKVVLVNFWATWCPPCREEIPELIALQKQFKDRLQIVGVSEDDDPPENVLKFSQQKGMNYPIVMATPELIAAYGGVAALPTTFVVDTQGRVVQKHAGLYPMDSYVRDIRALLGLPVDARIETFEDTGQVFLKNAANATELPGVNLAGLTPEQKKRALHRLNAESCTCGCPLTLSQCRVNDTECPVSTKLAAQVVKEIVHGGKPARAPVPETRKSPRKEN